MKAIRVRFHPCTNNRGSRYSACDADGNKVLIQADLALNMEQRRDEAVLALCQKMKWKGTLVRGGFGNDHYYVWLDQQDLLKVGNVVVEENAA